jgi:hypothetical protein
MRGAALAAKNDPRASEFLALFALQQYTVNWYPVID